MTAPVDDLMRRAVKARQRAQTAFATAVREARAADWSWERISTALGGSPDPEKLRRAFDVERVDEGGAGRSCCGGESGCACAGCGSP